jgi:hypothetical protein
MHLDIYVGNLDCEGFKWEGGNWNGNVPRRESDFFPFGHSSFYKLLKKIDDGIFDGKQVDWGGWVARLTPKEIELFLDECHADVKLSLDNEETLSLLDDKINLIRDFLYRLDQTKKYALVGTET